MPPPAREVLCRLLRSEDGVGKGPAFFTLIAIIAALVALGVLLALTVGYATFD